jgi:hypothetical protein
MGDRRKRKEGRQQRQACTTVTDGSRLGSDELRQVDALVHGARRMSREAAEKLVKASRAASPA